ncbi:MAG: 4Fe-4S dicluster domain-containing protein [Deltaproteobacteria bacterium]
MTTIDVSKVDPSFVRDLMDQPGGEELSACFSCRTCSASCPIAAVNDRFNPTRIIRMALYGMKEAILNSDFIWLCSSCYACQERCPQGVGITDLMTLLKNMAVREGHTPSGIKAQMDLIKGQGRIYPLDDFDNKKRDKAGLPPLPTSCEVVKTLFP